jgi:hypothetical protein
MLPGIGRTHASSAELPICSLDNGVRFGHSALVRRSPFLSKVWVGVGVLLVASATWWVVAPNWNVHTDVDDGKAGGFGSGLAFDRDFMWTVTVPFTIVLALIATVLRPREARLRWYWATLVAASVLIANLRAPLWALVAAAVAFALVRDPSEPPWERRRREKADGQAVSEATPRSDGG